MGNTLLDIKSLSCERGYRQLFQSLSFTVSEGEVVQVKGPNGSGKSSLLKCIAGISSDYEGDIFWSGQSIGNQRNEFARACCYLGHQQGVKRGLSPYENLKWFTSLYPHGSRYSITEVLQLTELEPFSDTPCSQLSAGQNQRVALARLLVSDAVLWILDEPFTAIDKSGVKAFEQMISAFAEAGGAILLTTHHELGLSAPVKDILLGH